MSIKSLQRTYFFILLTLLVGKGDGQWKKSSKDALNRDIRIYKKLTEKIKRDFEEFYNDYSHEPINDYFLEEIDYVESKIEKYFTSKERTEEKKDVTYRTNHTKEINYYNVRDKIYSNNIIPINTKGDNISNTTPIKTTNSMWPKFDEILMAIGKKYDWKNDRWIKVKAKIKDKEKIIQQKLKLNADPVKHNFKYRIVKLNRVKSKRKVVIAVTAVR